MSIIRDLFTTSVNSTMMSMDERFTYIQKNVRPVQTTVMTIRANNSAQQQASIKNRRLAMQMEKRLSAMAALKIKKKSIRQRLGVPLVVLGAGNNVRDRLTLQGGNRGRGRNTGRIKRNRGRSLRRSRSIQSLSGNLQRSRSLQSLNNDAGVPHRSRSRSRTRNRTPSISRTNSIARRRRSASGTRQGRLKKTINPGLFRQQIVPSQRGRRSNSVNFRNRKLRMIGNQGLPKEQKSIVFKRGGGRSRGRSNVRNVGGFQNSNRGRGQFRGRGGRGRGRGQSRNLRLNRNGQSGPVPTKEELDKELEQYMANTKSQLDKDIDTYMKESSEAPELWD